MSKTATVATAPEPSPDQVFRDFVARYKSSPTLFVREVLQCEPDEWQAEFMDAIARGERRVSVVSGHGTGKSTAAAWISIWYILFHYPVKIVITAPTASQLFDALFAEIRRQCGSLPPALAGLLEATSDRIVLKSSPTEAFISARTSSKDRPESLAGVHSDHVMLICDEASGIPEEVFESAAGSMSGENAVTILLGNPTRTSGLFFKSHHELKDRWWTRRVSCLTSPRVSKDFIADMAQRYGENSNAYRVRVLGEFPISEDDTLIGRGVVLDAMNRDITPSPTTPEVWGLDVSRYGNDRTALCKRKGPVVREIRTWRGLDLMQTAGQVIAEYNAMPVDQRPVEILVDSIGIGAGLVDRLREVGLPVRGINVSESSSTLSNCYRLRDELWKNVKDWLEKRDCKLPNDEDLLTDLTSCRYSFNSQGKLRVESKDDLKRRGFRSPDLADSLCLSLSSQAVTLSGGPSLSWGKPLKRGIKGLV
jgi:phage terminase large subunit